MSVRGIENSRQGRIQRALELTRAAQSVEFYPATYRASQRGLGRLAPLVAHHALILRDRNEPADGPGARAGFCAHYVDIVTRNLLHCA